MAQTSVNVFLINNFKVFDLTMKGNLMKFVHGGDIYTAKEKGFDEILDFSANINPMGLPAGVKKALIDEIAACENYPDPFSRKLREAISLAEGIDEEHIICGNGAADLIFRLVQAVKPATALVPAPTFAEYELALDSVGCKVEHFPLNEDSGFDVGEDFLQFLYADSASNANSISALNPNPTTKFKMIFLCNPNNPTGKTISAPVLDKVLTFCEKTNCLLIIDECFLDFTETGDFCTMVTRIAAHPNLFILKAFTKTYAMPGLRLGYGFCSHKELLGKVEAMGQPWSVSVPAQLAGVAALKEKEYFSKSLALIARERSFLIKEFAGLPFKVFPPEANYIFFKAEPICKEAMTDGQALSRNFLEAMLKEGILIRDCSNYKGLGHGYYRVAVKDREANQRLIKALRTYFT